jgi:hypothetical protein
MDGLRIQRIRTREKLATIAVRTIVQGVHVRRWSATAED